MGILRSQLRGAIGSLRLRRIALVIMPLCASGVTRPRVIIVLGRRGRPLLEEMMHPMGSGE